MTGDLSQTIVGAIPMPKSKIFATVIAGLFCGVFLAMSIGDLKAAPEREFVLSWIYMPFCGSSCNMQIECGGECPDPEEPQQLCCDVEAEATCIVC
jgi:hypothetical protein